MGVTQFFWMGTYLEVIGRRCRWGADVHGLWMLLGAWAQTQFVGIRHIAINDALRMLPKMYKRREIHRLCAHRYIIRTVMILSLG